MPIVTWRRNLALAEEALENWTNAAEAWRAKDGAPPAAAKKTTLTT